MFKLNSKFQIQIPEKALIAANALFNGIQSTQSGTKGESNPDLNFVKLCVLRVQKCRSPENRSSPAVFSLPLRPPRALR
jgi:hypothetical protein